MTLDKRSSFTDLTQRSAYAFRFGLRAGNASGSTRPDEMTARNEFHVPIMQEIATVPEDAAFLHSRVPGDFLHPRFVRVTGNPGAGGRREGS
jgi:hypothetical protein